MNGTGPFPPGTDELPVPPDKDALGLAEEMGERISSVLLHASVTQGDLERLVALLEERDAEREALACALIARPGGYPEWDEEKLREEAGRPGSDRHLAQWELDVRAVLKGTS